MRTFLFLKAILFKFFKINYYIYFQIRYIFVSLWHITWKPFIFRKDLDLTYRFFRHLFFPEWLSFYHLFTHLIQRVEYFEFFYPSNRVGVWFAFDSMHDGILSSVHWFYEFCLGEEEEIDEHTKLFHWKKTIIKTCEGVEVEKTKANFPDLSDLLQPQDEELRMPS